MMIYGGGEVSVCVRVCVCVRMCVSVCLSKYTDRHTGCSRTHRVPQGLGRHPPRHGQHGLLGVVQQLRIVHKADARLLGFGAAACEGAAQIRGRLGRENGWCWACLCYSSRSGVKA